MEPSAEVSIGSVTVLLNGVKRGDDQAITQLWSRFAIRVEALARKKLFDPVESMDVANWAFFCFIQKAAKGDLRKLNNREDAWAWLALLTSRECSDVLKKRFAIKRGGALLARATAAGESPFVEISAQNEPIDYRVATVEFDAFIADFGAYLPADRPLRKLFELLLAGAKTKDIASETGIELRTVQRHIVEIGKHLQVWMESQRHD